MSETQVLAHLEVVKNNQYTLEQHQLGIIKKLKGIEDDLRLIKVQLTQGYSQNVHHKLDTILRKVS